MYEMPFLMDHTSEEQLVEKVSNIKQILQSCVKLLNDPSSIKILQNLLEICNIVGIGEDPGFNATTLHQQNPNYQPFQQHLQSR
jgi:hypothetical protein